MLETNEYLIGQQPPLPLSLHTVKPGWHHVDMVVHAFHNNVMSASPTVLSRKPTVLLLGEIVLAHAEWDSLTAIAELRVSKHAG